MTPSSPTLGLYYDENAELPPHASLTYREVKAAGPPSQPLEFPKPTVHRACTVSGRALDHRLGKVYEVHAMSRTDKRLAYLIKKNIAQTAFGCIKLCVVLRRRSSHNLEYYGGGAEWISTDEMVAIKASSKRTMREHRGKHLEDPLKGGYLPSLARSLWWLRLLLKISCIPRVSTNDRGALFRKCTDTFALLICLVAILYCFIAEAAALQYIGNYHSNVLGCLEVLQDDDYLYTVMPYCSGGDMYSLIRRGGHLVKRNRTLIRSNSDKSLATTTTTHSNSSCNTCRRPEETQARVWFRQLLDALLHLQKKGVCHRDLSLDNIVLEANNNLVLIDFGLCLRVPYADSSNYGGVCDVSEGTDRLLIKTQGRSGNLTYLAPEIIEGDEAFDGFAADIWSAGVILFVLLVGLAPFKWPNSSDVRYAQIKRGKLRELMTAHLPENTVSDEACDLLQNMLWRDPRQRLTLAQILQHPWVVGSPDCVPDFLEGSESSSKFAASLSDKGEPSPKASPSGALQKHATVHFDESVAGPPSLASFFYSV